MKLFGRKAAHGMTDDEKPIPLSAIQVTPEYTPTNVPKNQEVDPLEASDLLGEADVYWTYGKWHDAMQIYEWWISNNGTGPGNEVALQATARKYLDCAAKAMDFDAFTRMMRKLIDQQVDAVFLQLKFRHTASSPAPLGGVMTR